MSQQTPGSLNLSIITESGVGSEHVVTMRGLSTPEQTKSQVFDTSQIFTFEDLTPGDLCTLTISAVSQGTQPVVKKYSISEVLYPNPAVVTELVWYQNEATTWWHARVVWTKEGIVHNWVLLLVAKPYFSGNVLNCLFDTEQSDLTW